MAISYPDMEAAISLHADNEHEQLDLNHPVAILHIGGPRDLESYPKSYIKSHRYNKLDPLKTYVNNMGV